MLFNITSRAPEGKVIRIGRLSICLGDYFLPIKSVFSKKKVERSEETFYIDQQEEDLHLTASDLLRVFDNKIDSYNSIKLRDKLNGFTDQDLNELITEILYEAISYQRHLTDVVMDTNKEKDNAFFKAAIWHLSDVLHNMPRCLGITDVKQSAASIAEEKVMYVEHFFCYLKAFQELGEKHFTPPNHLLLTLNRDYEPEYLTLIEDYC